jgi:tetratricopeptide (TPR) repeat protein
VPQRLTISNKRVRVERAWAAILFVVGAAACFVPLFDVLGYEWALVMAIVASLAGAQVAAVRVWRERHERAPSAVTAAEARPGATVARLWGSTTLLLWLALLLPLAAVLLNALRVRNCDLRAGLAWFVMLPMLSAAMGAGAGVVAGLVRPWRGRVAPSVLAIAIVVASVAWGVWRFYAAPPIFGYDPFVGYFAGTLYDEEVAITAAFGWARLYQLALLAGWLGLCALALDATRLCLTRPSLSRLRPFGAALIAFAVAGSLWHARATLGFVLSADDIARRLGAETRTAHFVLHYSPTGPYAKEIAAYAEDDEFRWHELEQLFGAAPAPPVHAFLFDNAGQKRALMGAGHTFIAKPWRREIYLQHDPWPQEVTRHELAHVFAGQYGDPIFGIARRGLRFNVGLIEGVAVAASWPGGGQSLTPHQIVKILRDAKLVDERTLPSVMGPSFFGLNAAQAYNIAGSFCRFLIDTRGVAKLEAIYRAAGAGDSWRQIYGVDLATLQREWLAMIDRQIVPAQERAVALERLKRPSVFRRVCAHAQALRKQSAREAAQAGDRARALAEWSAVCAEDDSPDNVLDRVEAMIAAGSYDDARRTLATLGELDAVHRARAQLLASDAAVLRGGAADYDAMAGAPLDEATARLVTVKREVAHWPPGDARTTLLSILAAPSGTRDAALDLVTLQKLADAHPERALLHYLLGRQLFARGRYADAADELGRALAARLPDERFVREASRLRGAALFRLGRRAEARAIFLALADDPQAPEAARLDAREWLARCDFTQP